MTRRRVLVALLAAPWVAWALVRTLALDGGHPLVAAIALTPYVAATAIVPVLAALVAREWVVAALAALALAALALAVLPRALDGPQLAEAESEGEAETEAEAEAEARTAARTLTVMTSNLLHGEADARAVLRIARDHDVDVLSLQELTREAVERLDAAGARRLLPRRVLRPAPRASGMGLMARRPLRAAATPGREIARRLSAMLALPGGEELGLVAVHPVPPLSGERTRAWQSVLRGLPDANAGGRRHVLIGDFNATLDHRELRRVLARGYTDAADATGDGLRPTFPVGAPRALLTVDHVLVPSSIRVRRVSVRDVAGSDHRAVVAELVLPARLSSTRGRARRAP